MKRMFAVLGIAVLTFRPARVGFQRMKATTTMRPLCLRASASLRAAKPLPRPLS